MLKICIATHGHYASGIYSSFQLIAGAKENIDVIEAYVKEDNLPETIADYMAKQNPEDTLIVFTDLLGGSVNQAFAPYLQTHNFHLVTGINLAMLLELAFLEEVNADDIRKIVENGKSQIVYVNDLLNTAIHDDDSNFED